MFRSSSGRRDVESAYEPLIGTGPHSAKRERAPTLDAQDSTYAKMSAEEFQRQMLVQAKKQTFWARAYFFLFFCYVAVLFTLGGIAFHKFVVPLTSPSKSDAMLNPANINSALTTVYSTLGSADFIAQFAANVTGNMWQPADKVNEPPPEVPTDGSYGKVFTASLVNTTSHVGSIIQAVQPGAVGALMNGTAAALGSLNMTALGASVQALLVQASAIADEVKQSINPADVQKLMGHVAEIDIAGELDRALDLGQMALNMIKNMGKAK